jgi:alpha-D-ribose 1-methylphosphonate 5-triphosphate synthase subunit PhnH
MNTPLLTPRSAREQSTFRRLLEALARPGRLHAIAPHDQGGPFAAAVTVLEALLDHEVSFATSPANPEVEEALLRLTGSHTASVGEADYVLAWGAGVAAAIDAAKTGVPEYPDRGATVIAAVESISGPAGPGHRLRLRGPGIRDSATIAVRGFGPEAVAAFARRNATLPCGLDVVLVTPEGVVAGLGRYTRITEGS